MKTISRLLVQPETIADIINDALAEGKEIYKGPPTEEDVIEGCCYIDDGRVSIKVITKYKGITHTYYTYKDGREIIEGVLEGSQCYAVMARHYWKPEHTLKEEGLSASPLIGINPLYNRTRHYAWSYDLNSAYGAVILNGWIDVSVPPQEKIVEEGEVGFSANLSDLVDVGEYSMFVFKKCPPPPGLVAFINKYYDRKTNPKSRKEKQTAKNMICHTVGCLQGKNYFLRAYVVASCNKFILSLIDKDTLYYNTDCIVSKRRRPDLEANLGPGIGQWKIDHEGLFAYDGCNYQWDYEKPAWRSVPKAYIPEHFDLLDETTHLQISETNLWYMDWDNIAFTIKEGLE